MWKWRPNTPRGCGGAACHAKASVSNAIQQFSLVLGSFSPPAVSFHRPPQGAVALNSHHCFKLLRGGPRPGSRAPAPERGVRERGGRGEGARGFFVPLHGRPWISAFSGRGPTHRPPSKGVRRCRISSGSRHARKGWVRAGENLGFRVSVRVLAARPPSRGSYAGRTCRSGGAKQPDRGRTPTPLASIQSVVIPHATYAMLNS